MRKNGKKSWSGVEDLSKDYRCVWTRLGEEKSKGICVKYGRRLRGGIGFLNGMIKVTHLILYI